MNKLSILLCLCFLVGTTLRAGDSPAPGYKGPREKLHVYLLIGQSNMAGRAPYTDEEAGPIDRCLLLNDKDAWEPARNPLNRYSTIRKGLGMQKMNPGYSFAKKVLGANPDVSIGLVVNAKGGSSIEQWGRDTRFYKEAIRRTKKATETGTLKGILWHQGESNSGAPDGYLEKLKTLVENLRADLGIKDLPFVAGQINEANAKSGPINEQIARLPAAVPATGYASSRDLKCKDAWHFGPEAMKLLGERYAEAVLKLQGK